jgi:DNA end-binding protein Ku
VPRALWNGSLSFGLVNVPVQLVSAVRDRDVHFRQLHEKDGAPIDTRRFCAKEDAEVPFEEIGRGFETDDGKQVVLTDEELAAASPRKTRTIDIEAFVGQDDLDPLLLDHPYLLLPAGETDGVRRAYRLLADVLADSGRLALGRFVLRAKEHLVAIGTRDGLLSLTTMRFPDEVRPAKDVGDAGGSAGKPKPAALKAAVGVIEAMSGDWDPGRYEDQHRKRLLAAVKQTKRTAQVEEEHEEREPTAPADLMETLKRSLSEARGKEKAGR